MIAYTSDAKGPGDLMLKRSSGTGIEEMLYGNGAFNVPSDFSPDGKTILISQLNTKTGFDLALFSLEDHKMRMLLQTPYNESAARFSPDGKWFAYSSNESGKQQVYVLPLSGNRGKWQVSTEGGIRPHWSRDGKVVYYISTDSKMMAVDVSARGDVFNAGAPRVLFPVKLKAIPGNAFDPTPDGKRFIINTPAEQAEVIPLTLVQNWTAALKK
jgi:Tol biopolymer transport system component